ncbi:MAG: peptidoglycan-binding protein [Geminicoccaceae bacterium]
MAKRKTTILLAVLAFAGLAAAGALYASLQIESPADAAARAAPPPPSPILVPVEERVLSSDIVTRGTARFGLPQSISIAPSVLKPEPGLIATLPRPNAQFEEGDLILTASGRPLFVLQGETLAYRDLAPGRSGNDVLQLEESLERLGFDPGPVDGSYDQSTSKAVGEWYQAVGWEPFGPTPEQLAAIRALQREWADAKRNMAATRAAAEAAVLRAKAVRATTEHNSRAAEAELTLKSAERRRLLADRKAGNGGTLSIETVRAQSKQNNRAAVAELTQLISERELIVLDPRQPKSARDLADAKLELARAAVERTRLEGEQAIRAADRQSGQADEQIRLSATMVASAESALASAHREGEIAVRDADDAKAVAALEATLATERFERLEAQLAAANSKLGVQVPVDEIVFIPSLPVRVEDVGAKVGEAARGAVMSVTDNQLSIDALLTLDAAPLVQPAMPVTVDEQALGIKATGQVAFVAETPGTRGADGYHVYFEVKVDETTARLNGISVRLIIPIETTKGAVIAVPVSALSLAADGTSRVQIQRNGTLQFMVVEPGLSANGYVEVAPIDGELLPGELVVVGFDNPGEKAVQ